MIKITKATKKEIKKFDEKEWHGVDVEHYGRRVEWKKKDFIFKATDKGKIVGTLSGRYEPGVVFIKTIIVAEDRRGFGIGKALVDKAKEFGKKFGAHKVWLITGKDWKANKFYKKLGFKKVADLPKHHFKKDFLIYSKFI